MCNAINLSIFKEHWKSEKVKVDSDLSLDSEKLAVIGFFCFGYKTPTY